MPFSLNQVHVFAAVEGQAQPKLVAEHHYIRLKGSGAEYPLYIQEGQVYGEGGDLFAPEDLPKWFWREVKKCSLESLVQVGWDTNIDPELEGVVTKSRPS